MMNLQLFAIDDDKLIAFTFDHVGQVDELGKVTGNYVTIQEYLDSRGIDLQDKHNALIDTLKRSVLGNTGAQYIGINAVGVTASTVEAAIAEVQANLADVSAGGTADNSLTEQKMAADMKKQAGGVYPYDDGDQNATDISTNSSNIAQNAADILEVEEIRVATDTTGSANAYLADVANKFDLLLDKNVLRVTPNFTCTGASTINVTSKESGAITKAIKKFDIDADDYVAIEADDMKKNTPTELTWFLSQDFFVLAPKSGAKDIVNDDDKVAFDKTVRITGLDSDIQIAYTFPENCVSVLFYDENRDDGAYNTYPISKALADADNPGGAVAEILLYDSSGSEILEILKANEVFGASETGYLYNMSLMQVGDNIQYAISYIKASNGNVDTASGIIAGSLSEATIRCNAYGYGDNGADEAEVEINGFIWTYTQ